MAEVDKQRRLGRGQISAFYHENFVEDQVQDFVEMVPVEKSEVIVDIGGGCGFFAKALSERIGVRVRVLDTDQASVDKCRIEGIDATVNDALRPDVIGDERVACFNLILHHLVGATERDTAQMQAQAISAWKGHARAIFVNEYVYESFVLQRASGAIIYSITRSQLLSAIARVVALVAPSLRANTLGVGVRFRASAEWKEMFSEMGFDVVRMQIGQEEHVSFPRRLLLIKSCRRDSFVLVPRAIF